MIESLDLTRNIFWLASCFSKIKKLNSHFLGNQSGIAGFPIFILNSLTAIDGHDHQYFNELRSTVVSRRIFIRLQSLIAR